MRIGVPREIKEMENRVGVTPAGVSELVRERSSSIYRNKSRSWKRIQQS